MSKAEIIKCNTGAYDRDGFQSVNLDLVLNGQHISVSIQAIDGKLRVLTGPTGTNIAPLTFPNNMSIDNFGYPSD